MHHWDLEARVVLASTLQDLQRLKGFKATDEHECVEAVILERRGDATEINVRQRPVGAEL